MLETGWFVPKCATEENYQFSHDEDRWVESSISLKHLGFLADGEVSHSSVKVSIEGLTCAVMKGQTMTSTADC